MTFVCRFSAEAWEFRVTLMWLGSFVLQSSAAASMDLSSSDIIEWFEVCMFANGNQTSKFEQIISLHKFLKRQRVFHGNLWRQRVCRVHRRQRVCARTCWGGPETLRWHLLQLSCKKKLGLQPNERRGNSAAYYWCNGSPSAFSDIKFLFFLWITFDTCTLSPAKLFCYGLQITLVASSLRHCLCLWSNCVKSIHCMHLRNNIFVSSAGSCPTSHVCCLSSSTGTPRLDPNSAAGLILPLLCSRVAYRLLDMAIGWRPWTMARSTLLEGAGWTVRLPCPPRQRDTFE